MDNASERALQRIVVFRRHLSPACASTPISLQPCAGSSYERIHGDLPSDPVLWQPCTTLEGPPLQDLLYEMAEGEAIAKITINRPTRRNAFRPQTVSELQRVFSHARDDSNVGVVILTGQGTEAFCSGGDQAVRDKHGYVGDDNIGRLNILDVQVQIRRLPKPVIAMVAGYCVGGGHVLHMVCDLTIAADNAVFGQTGPKVGSFDGGYGCSVMARSVSYQCVVGHSSHFLLLRGTGSFEGYCNIQIGQKKAREMWFLARFYTAKEALDMGLINTVVPLAQLEGETVRWCRQILRNSPTALRLLKSALNATDDGHAGLQEFAGNATLLFYGSEEAAEGRNAYMEKRPPDFSKFPRLP
ncbi:hypothetical protein KP509_35G014700 [Ceratopteris richardii]|uniref:1,4-dihydroxy-2-naphthoyl-CoA synthase n=1 Tax=Ceratopteris richardii TaxID=49495 RepID=A0A8T2QES5_CERRI|nr:hypothetical protein KP509_35G014700 [Ceratopteris richardii]